MAVASESDLTGCVAVVTGGSRGIGRAIGLELAAAGADVLVHGGRDRQAADDVAAQVAAVGRKSHVVIADLADGEALARFAESAWNWRGGIDVLVNNAGADVLTGSAAAVRFEEKLDRLWKVDVLAAVRLSRMIGERMRARGHGTIINMGWDQAATGMAGDSGELFAATKGAVMAFTRSLAKSLAPQVRVNCLAPGWIKTAWGEQASAQWQDRAVRDSLLGRWGTPDDVARAARFLASGAAQFMTGQIIAVNGGRA